MYLQYIICVRTPPSSTIGSCSAGESGRPRPLQLRLIKSCRKRNDGVCPSEEKAPNVFRKKCQLVEWNRQLRARCSPGMNKTRHSRFVHL